MPQEMTKDQQEQVKVQLDELEDFIEQFTERAKLLPVRGPSQMIGVLNVLAMIYRRTAQEGIDPTKPDAPLIALPNHLRMVEERIDAVFKTIATTHMRTISET